MKQFARGNPLIFAAGGSGLVGMGSLVLWVQTGHPGGWSAFGVVLALAGIAAGCGGLLLTMRAERAAASAREQAFEDEKTELAAHARDLEAAKAECEIVLGSVHAHLMLVDRSYAIQSRHSSELSEILKDGDGTENFLAVLRRILSDRMFRTSRDYLALLFDETKKERTVLKVNPFDEVEVNAFDAQGRPAVRFLKFAFRRIVEGAAISRVLVSVEDITERTVLERQLRDSENQKVRQFELLIGILHVKPHSLDAFVAMANGQLAAVDEALKASDFSSAGTGQTALLLARLDVVLRCVHNIKGNASLLRLEDFEKQAAEFERKVIELKFRPTLGGDDFLGLVIALAEFRSDLDLLETLRAKLAGIQRAVEIREEVGDDLVTALRELAARLSATLGKHVRLDADGFDSRPLPALQRLIIKDVLIQLVRNSLVHGIEAPAERTAAKKPGVATIDIHPIATSDDCFAFTYRDDGRGLDASRIRKRAVALGLLESDRANAGASDVASFIFEPGFSTLEQSTADAGRGMGMNLVKNRVVDECGGEITVNSQAGEFCEFTFDIPTNRSRLGVAG